MILFTGSSDRLLPGTAIVVALVALVPQTTAGGRSDSVREVRFTSSDGTELAGTVWLPEGRGPHAGVVFVQGRSYGSREQFSEHAARAASIGVAGLVFDGRGSGQSGGESGKHTLAQRLADVEAAFEMLRGNPDVDPCRVGLFGHSAGGWLVPVVAQRRAEVAFLVLHAGPAVSLADQQAGVVRELMRRSDQEFGPEDYEEAAAYQRELVLRAGAGETWEQLAPFVAGAGDRPWSAFIDLPESARDGELAYYRRNPHDSRPALSSTLVPLLAMYGGDDWIVPPALNTPALEAAMAEAGNRLYDIVVFPGADHGLEVPEQGYPEDYWKTLLGWLQARSGDRSADCDG
jgi:dienelactone hydrolase